MNLDFETIREGLERLRTAAAQSNVFGAETHNFILHPPLPEPVVQSFEARHAVRLPADYRQFLTEVGDGGAGPYYGLFRLGEMDDGWGHSEWKENGGLVGHLSSPFPHAEAWNDLSGEPDFGEDEEEYERQLPAFEERYWSPALVNGAIPICHLGCASRHWLVVTGAEAGHVWCDERADRRGLSPLSGQGGERISFYRWYRDWLDDALGKLE